MSLPPFLAVTPPPTSVPSSARLKALYASTSSQRETNPTGYEANLSWWSGVIEECLRTGWISDDRLILTMNEDLLDRFENAEGGKPKGFGGFITSMTTPPAKLYPLQSFLNTPTPIHDPESLAYRLLARPLLWTVGRLNPWGGERIEREEVLWKRVNREEYVHLSLLERAASLIVQKLESEPPINHSDTLYSIASFRERFGSLIPPRTDSKMALPAGEHKYSERDIRVLIKWLSRDVVTVVSDGEVVKIIREDEGAEEITEADRGTLTILTTIRNVEKQVESLSAQISKSTSTAKDQLKANQKSLALSTLRSKKNLEDLLTKRLATMHQLQTVLSSINTAQNDVEVMKAFSTATRTLKGVLQNPNLEIGKVESTMEEMAEALASQEEIDSAIQHGGRVAVGAAGVVVDEDELERELEDLVLDETAKRKEREAADKDRLAKEESSQRQHAEEAAAKAKENEAAKMVEEKAKALGLVQPPPGKVADTTQDQWQRTYEDAQQRKADETKRAESERLQREERRVAAE